MRASQKPQLELFSLPAPPKPIRLGKNQRAVFDRALRHGNVRVREAGRIVYIRRGWQDPSRAGNDWLDRAGLRVILSLRKLGLLRYDRETSRWILTAKGRRSSDLIGPERSEGPPLARSQHPRRFQSQPGTLRTRLGQPCKSRLFRSISPSISAAGSYGLGVVVGDPGR